MDQPKVPKKFLFDVGDFLIETQGWSVAEVGAYVRLLIAQWNTGSLPADTQKLSRLCGIDHGNFKKLWGPTLKSRFEPNGGGVLHNKRLEKVREDQRKYLKQQSQYGSRGAKTRWGQANLKLVRKP